MGTKARLVGDSHKIHKYIGECLLVEAGKTTSQKSLNNHHYGQKFHF